MMDAKECVRELVHQDMTLDNRWFEKIYYLADTDAERAVIAIIQQAISEALAAISPDTCPKCAMEYDRAQGWIAAYNKLSGGRDPDVVDEFLRAKPDGFDVIAEAERHEAKLFYKSCLQKRQTVERRHDGDCTIYAALENGRPTDGICTCGYAHRHLDYHGPKMFSPERQATLAAAKGESK